MLKIFNEDSELKECAFGCYAYPTSIIKFPWNKRMASIQEIASGLRTHIDAYHADKKEVILVGHSLGGIIARQYILNEIKCQRGNNISGVVLFATPHTGSALANIGKSFTFFHRHLHQLCKGSDILNIINNDWVYLKVENRTKALYIVGGGDKVVNPESAAPYLGADNVRTLIDYNHTGVIKAKNNDDIRFKILKDFVLTTFKESNDNSGSHHAKASSKGDVLFDVYSHDYEPYYIKRLNDRALSVATQSANAWVSGAPGIGKTASLKRLAEISEWHLYHIMLDSYQGHDAFKLMKEVLNILYERCDLEINNKPEISCIADLISCFRRIFINLAESSPVAILIEEIPLSSGNEYTIFLDIAYQLLVAADTLKTKHKIIWLFSSIRNPNSDVRLGTIKIRERIQFFEFEPWNNEDIGSLVSLIDSELQVNISNEDYELILKHASGSPRFVKMLFRRRRNEVGALKSLNELLISVQKDLS